MKTSNCIVAFLLLASPLLAVVDTFASTKIFLAGTASVKYGKMADPADATKSRLYFEISGPASLATTTPAAFCIMVGVAGSVSTVTDWKGADIGTFSTVYSAGSGLFTAATNNPWDLSCNAVTATGANNYCTTVGLADVPSHEAGQNWAWPGALVNDWVSYRTGTLKFEIMRLNAAANTGVDLPYAINTSKILFSYSSSACATTGSDVTFIGSDIGIVDSAAPGDSSSSSDGSGSVSGSFGSLTYISWIALFLTLTLLN